MSNLLGHIDGAAQCRELVVHLLQLGHAVAAGDDAAAGLKPQFVVAADEGADGDGLVQVAVKADEAYAAAVGAAVVWLVLR